jgi:hypothetical protein
MDFRLDCPCGEHVTVTEASAGATLKCGCGRPISVPSLPTLRVAAGLPPEVLGPEQVIARLLATGKLPGKVCLGCGFETDQVLDVLTECETIYRTNTGTPLWFWLVTSVIFLPFVHFIYVLFRMDGEEAQSHGRETIFVLPIPVCEHCRGNLRRRKRLKNAMRQIPEYRRLLEKFPWARVKLRRRAI